MKILKLSAWLLLLPAIYFIAQAPAQQSAIPQAQPAAQSKPCVIVSANQQVKFVTAFGAVHAERFVYIDSMNLSMSQIKSEYKRKALEKLEKDGVKVVVTNGAGKRTDVSVGVGVNQTISEDLKAAREACQQ